MINACPFKNENNSIHYNLTQTRTLFLQIKLWIGLVNRITASASKRDKCRQRQTQSKHMGKWGCAEKKNKQAAESGQTLVLLASSNWTAWEMKKKKWSKKSTQIKVQCKQTIFNKKNLANTKYLHREKKKKKNNFLLPQIPISYTESTSLKLDKCIFFF